MIDSDIKIINSINYHFENEPGSGRSTFFKLLLNENSWSIPENNNELVSLDIIANHAKVCYFNEKSSFFPGKINDSITTFGYSLNNEKFASVCDDLGIQKFINNIPDRLDFRIDANQTNLSFRTALMMDIARAISTGCTVLLFDYSLDSLDIHFTKSLQQICERKKIGMIIATRNLNLISPNSIPIKYVNFDPRQSYCRES